LAVPFLDPPRPDFSPFVLSCFRFEISPLEAAGFPRKDVLWLARLKPSVPLEAAGFPRKDVLSQRSQRLEPLNSSRKKPAPWRSNAVNWLRGFSCRDLAASLLAAF
jgi:hypothetical protein